MLHLTKLAKLENGQPPPALGAFQAEHIQLLVSIVMDPLKWMPNPGARLQADGTCSGGTHLYTKPSIYPGFEACITPGKTHFIQILRFPPVLGSIYDGLIPWSRQPDAVDTLYQRPGGDDGTISVQHFSRISVDFGLIFGGKCGRTARCYSDLSGAI